ncbi:hypothetical protein HID58_056748, partial [Brassica napus]
VKQQKMLESLCPLLQLLQYFDWLNLEKTYRELSPAEQQYFVTASLAGHFE